METGLRNYLIVTAIMLPSGVGKMKSKPKFTQVGAFLALWVIAYGFVQASAPRLVRRSHHGQGPSGGTARLWAYQSQGLEGCLWWSAGFVLAAALLSFKLPEVSASGKENSVV